VNYHPPASFFGSRPSYREVAWFRLFLRNPRLCVANGE
jgi:hypothetical protein